MTATTPIYGLSYPEGSDLVSTAPDSFKAMADTFEQALDQVDRRSTPTGVKPVIATTLNTLATTIGVTGQTGYVTADAKASNNGPYYWNGKTWMPYLNNTVQGTMKIPYSNSMLTLCKRDGIVTVSGTVTLTSNFTNVTNQPVNEKISEGFSPRQGTTGSILFLGNNSQNFSLLINEKREMKLSGGGNTGYYFTALGSWITE